MDAQKDNASLNNAIDQANRHLLPLLESVNTAFLAERGKISLHVAHDRVEIVLSWDVSHDRGCQLTLRLGLDKNIVAFGGIDLSPNVPPKHGPVKLGADNWKRTVKEFIAQVMKSQRYWWYEDENLSSAFR